MSLHSTLAVLLLVGTVASAQVSHPPLTLKEGGTSEASGVWALDFADGDFDVSCADGECDLIITKADDDVPESGDFGDLLATAPITQSGGTISTSMATDRLLGRDTAGTGVAEELTLDDTLEFTGAAGVQRAALSGDVDATAGSNTTTLDCTDCVSLSTETSGNYVDNITAGLGVSVTGVAGEGWEPSVAIDYAQTLAGNPALSSDQCIFIATASGGGLLCEGATANTNEQLYLFPDVDSVDTTQTIALTDTAPTGGDVTGSLAGGYAVSDNSHAHDSSTISGVDISADTNLSVVAPLTFVASDQIGVTDDAIDQPKMNDTQTLDANLIWALGNFGMEFQVGSPSSPGVDISATGNLGQDLVHIHQHTGNPTAGSPLSIEAEDPDYQPLAEVRVNAAGATANPVVGLRITTNDNDDTSFVPLQIQDDSAGTPDTLVSINSLGAPTWGDGSATMTEVYNPAGTSNPTWTATDGVLNLSTGALQVGGAAVSTGAHSTECASAGCILNAATTATTASVDDNDTSVATTAFVQAESVAAGDVTGSIGGGLAIGTDKVTNAQLADAAANSIKGNNTGGAANPVDLTATQATAMLDVFTTGAKGLAPASGGGTSNFLRADGVFAAPPGASGGDAVSVDGAPTTDPNFDDGGDINFTYSAPNITAAVKADAIDNTKLADMAANTLKGNNTGGAATPADLTVAQVQALLNVDDSPTYDVTKNGVTCDGTTDATTALNTLANTDNRTLVIPNGQFCLVSGPVTLGSNTNIRCTDNSGFIVTTKVCVGGNLPGASCDSNTQCDGGTCTGTAFAPTAGTGYPLLQAESGSPFNSVDGCVFKAQGIDGYPTCVGGSNQGQPCISTCAGGANAGRTCLSNTNCPSSTCTLDTGADCTGGGTCTGPSGYPSGTMTPGSAPSSGNIRAVDFANSAASFVSRNEFRDLRQTDTMLRVNTTAWVQENRWMTYEPTMTYGGRVWATSNSTTNSPPRAAAAVRVSGVNDTQLGAITVAGIDGIVARNRIDNYASGVAVAALASGAEVLENTIVARDGVAGSYGLVGPGSLGRAFSNTFATMDVGLTTLGTDTWILNNTFQVVGAAASNCAARISGPGVHAERNQLLISHPFCIGGAGEPKAPVTSHASFRENYHATLIFGGVGGLIVKVDDPGKRCQSGTDVGKACTTSGDCAASAACTPNYMEKVTIAGNSAMGGIANLSEAQFATATNGSGQLQQWQITDNHAVSTTATATDFITFPTVPYRCDGGANLDASCTPATCATDCGAGASCPSDCQLVLQQFHVKGNVVQNDMQAAYANWHDGFGALDGARLVLPAASCTAGTAAPNWDTPAANAPAAACVTGGGTPATLMGTLDFDATTEESAQVSFALPSDYLPLGGLRVRVRWKTAATTGTARWCARVACASPDDAADATFDTAACTNAALISGTANDLNDTLVVLTKATEASECLPGDLAYLLVYRDADDGADTINANDLRMHNVSVHMMH